MLGTLNGALEVRGIKLPERDIAVTAEGDNELVDGIVRLTAIRLAYRLRVPHGTRATVERALSRHQEKCPTAVSLGAAVRITWTADLEEADAPASAAPSATQPVVVPAPPAEQPAPLPPAPSTPPAPSFTTRRPTPTALAAMASVPVTSVSMTPVSMTRAPDPVAAPPAEPVPPAEPDLGSDPPPEDASRDERAEDVPAVASAAPEGERPPRRRKRRR